jgi:hypothetical protein
VIKNNNFFFCSPVYITGFFNLEGGGGLLDKKILIIKIIMIIIKTIIIFRRLISILHFSKGQVVTRGKGCFLRRIKATGRKWF